MSNRVTTSMMYGNLMSSLHDNSRRVLDLQRQMSTMRKYSKLSDNPAVIASSLNLEASLRANESYQKTHDNAMTMLKHSEGALNNVLNAAQAIRALVVQAGNGSLNAEQQAAIAEQIEANKQAIFDALNTKVAGKYLFGGTDTGTKPFVMDSDGRIQYMGSDERVKYEIEEGLLADVSFAGSEVATKGERSYFICSHEVPTDWKWTGREEKVQITVGSRTLAVYIPEQWIDEVATGRTKPTDYNEFRDPSEVSGISLDDLAMLVNRSLKEQGADMLVTATVEKDLDTNMQRMVLRSNTGEPVGLTGWPDTDYLPMPQSIAGVAFPKTGTTAGGNVVVQTPDWNHSMLAGNAAPSLTGLTGKTLTVVAGGATTHHTFAADPVDTGALLTELNTPGTLPAGVTASLHNGRLVLTSANGDAIRVDGTAADALFGSIRAGGKAKYNGLMGTANTLGWRDDTLGKGIRIALDGDTYDFAFAGKRSITDLVNEINATVPLDAGDVPVASVVSGRLVLQSTKGPITVSDHGAAGGVQQLLGYSGDVETSTSAVTVQLDGKQPIKVYINKSDKLENIAEKLNAVEGLYARTSADKDQLVVVAQRVGALPDDPLAVDAAAEKRHYPSFTLSGEGMGMALFDYTFSSDSATGLETGIVASREQTRPVDHSHMDVFDVLGMETGMKSVEFEPGRKLKVGVLQDPTLPYDPVTNPYGGKPLHWRVMSGSRVADITLNPGEYTLSELADRLKNAGAGWLEVTVDVFRSPGVYSEDDHETGLGTSHNEERATNRLVIRAPGGAPVLFLDMNGQRYAEELGLSTAVRTDPDTGVKDIEFPTAPCLDDELGVRLRVQLTCGREYDVRLSKKDVADPATGLVDRVRVMRQIAAQVNDQAGEELMKVAIPVDENNKEIPDSASLYTVTGASFSVVDLPVSDPAWTDHSGGIAAQMGIHTGVTSNMGAKAGGVVVGLKDGEKIGVAGTIRFESLGRKVEIDVSADDTAKSVLDRLRSQAGDWLYVNYFDARMGDRNGQAGDYPILSIAAKDGSAVNVLDVKGSVAREKLALSTGIQGTADIRALQWAEGQFPARTFDVSVAGYTHTIDLTAMRDINGNGNMDAADLVATINARMQDYDVRAELNKDGRLVVWSPRGYSVAVKANQLKEDGTFDADITNTFLGAAPATPYRGGYDLENANRTGPNGANTPHTQNVTIRSGANQRKQDVFGVLDEVMAAVKSENRTAISEIMLPRIDRFIDNVLKVLSTNGALYNRYESNKGRLVTDNTVMTESLQDMVMVEPEKVMAELMMAKFMQEASLSVVSQLIQPSLMDFLR